MTSSPKDCECTSASQRRVGVPQAESPTLQAPRPQLPVTRVPHGFGSFHENRRRRRKCVRPIEGSPTLLRRGTAGAPAISTTVHCALHPHASALNVVSPPWEAHEVSEPLASPFVQISVNHYMSVRSMNTVHRSAPRVLNGHWQRQAQEPSERLNHESLHLPELLIGNLGIIVAALTIEGWSSRRLRRAAEVASSPTP